MIEVSMRGYACMSYDFDELKTMLEGAIITHSGLAY